METATQAASPNVVELVPKEVANDNLHNSQAVEFLTGLLEQAKNGELTEFNMVYKVNGEYAHCWTGCNNLLELQGILHRCIHLTNQRMDEQQ
jgi:hypothetical protein